MLTHSDDHFVVAMMPPIKKDIRRSSSLVVHHLRRYLLPRSKWHFQSRGHQ
jgi:hypothetical protein